MAKFAFLIAVAAGGVCGLCEGGVFTDDSAILARAEASEDYSTNTLDSAGHAAGELNRRHNTSAYRITESLRGVNVDDVDVLSSLANWQIVAVADTLKANDEPIPARLAYVLADRVRHSESVTSRDLEGLRGDCASFADDAALQRAKAAELDAALSQSTTDHAQTIRILLDVRSKFVEMENRYRAESLECNQLRVRNANQQTTIQTYRQQRDENGQRAFLAEGRATKAESLANQRDIELCAASDRAHKAERQLTHLMTELGGLTLSMLPHGAYGGALCEVYCDIKAGR